MIFETPKPSPVSVNPVNATVSGSSSSIWKTRPSLLRTAWNAVRQAENHKVATEAKDFLSMLNEIITLFYDLGFEFHHLPPLRGVNVDDGSILLEWIFTEFRVGFSIEPEPFHSSWFLVSTDSLGQISAYGYIPETDAKKLILWLLNFIISNS
jgi:hypothetical protein